ncbi:MAG: glycosyltransferase family 2 protein [Rhodospirillaceae bacterium]
MISVLILTRNEETDLPACLQSVAWCDDVHVFDSFSTDRTVAIAEQAGAKVTQRRFDDFAAQRNAALEQLEFKHRWVLILDADERIPRELAAEMHLFVGEAPHRVAAARLRRRDFLYGTWLKHAQLSPYYIRLVRRGRVRYEREVNEVLKVDGDIVQLHEPFDHYPFSKGMTHWIAKHNVYSTMEAEQLLRIKRGMTKMSLRRALFARDFNERRVHQKELFYRMPLRPVVRFLYSYFVRGGVLDGRAGLTYALLQGFYEYFIVLKTRELEAQRETIAAAAPVSSVASTTPLTPS